MYGPERQRLIVEEARQVGRVEVTALAARFDVTSETVRRDLTALERQGLLRRVHGGAIPVERLGFEPGLDARAAAQTDQKERIAKAALAELPTEGAILIDAGTTTAIRSGVSGRGWSFIWREYASGICWRHVPCHSSRAAVGVAR